MPSLAAAGGQVRQGELRPAFQPLQCRRQVPPNLFPQEAFQGLDVSSHSHFNPHPFAQLAAHSFRGRIDGTIVGSFGIFPFRQQLVTVRLKGGQVAREMLCQARNLHRCTVKDCSQLRQEVSIGKPLQGFWRCEGRIERNGIHKIPLQ